MLKLLKYEMRKTLFAKLVVLGLAAVLEVWFLVSVSSKKNTSEGVALALLLLLAFCGIALFGIQSLVALHRDMNTRQGYMLFMTPNSCYRILGAKMLENGLTTLAVGVLFMALGFADIAVVMNLNDVVKEIKDFVQSFMGTFGISLEFTAGDVICVVVYILSVWMNTVSLACLADILSSSLLNGKRGGLLISFILFIALNYGLGKLVSILPDASGFQAMYLVRSAEYIVLAALTYVASANLMNKYLSV